MVVFDIGFHIGQSTDFYLKLGHKVVAFEADVTLYESGCKTFEKEIESGDLVLKNIGITPEAGVQDFFINKENREWSTFYRDAAMNWGEGKYEMVQVSTITPSMLFYEYGIPDYLKVDIEGFDIYIAEELRNLKQKPQLASFEANNRTLMRNLLLAGYDSFKIVDQSLIGEQSYLINDHIYTFSNHNTALFGDDANGLWLNFENTMYLYNRFENCSFGTSVKPGHWWDIHASSGREAPFYDQIDYMRMFINSLDNHCGMHGDGKPWCPASKTDGYKSMELYESQIRDAQQQNVLLNQQLSDIYSSRTWKVGKALQRVFRFLVPHR